MPELEKINRGDFQGAIPTPKTYEEPILTDIQRRVATLKALGVADLDHTFKNIEKPEGFEKTYKAFRGLVNGDKRFMLMVYGGTGNGKTYCCEATVVALYEKGIRCKRYRWSDIIRHLKELMKQGGYEAYFNHLKTQPYLILDDVGSGSTLGNWEWGELEDIVDYRIERALFTIITTNLDGKDIPARILSRFKDKSKAVLIYNEAQDQRPLKEIV